MENPPQAGWEVRQLRLWEQQIRESATPAQSEEDEEQEVPPQVAAVAGISTKARKSSEGICHKEVTRIPLRQDQQQGAELLSPSPKTDVESDQSRQNSKRNERKTKHDFWGGMWRQNLFNKYAEQWNRVHDEGKSLEINYSKNAGNSTIQELEEGNASVNGKGSNVEKASGKMESEQQYSVASQPWATSINAKEEEKRNQPQLQKAGRKTMGEKKICKNPFGASRDHGPKGIMSDLQRRSSQKPSQNSEHVLESGPNHILANINPSEEFGGGGEDPKMNEGPDKRLGVAEDLKSLSELKLSDHQSNWSESPRKLMLMGSAKLQGTDIQEKGATIVQECDNSKQLEGRNPNNNNRTGIPRNVSFKERSRSERIQGAMTKNGGNITTMKTECELSEKSEGLESKESEGRDVNRILSRKESNRRTKGSLEACAAQDPKGYKGIMNRKEGQDSLRSESGRQETQDKRRLQQQWGLVDWTACANNKALTAAAAWLQQEKPRHAAGPFKERELSFLKPRYRTIYRVKDTHCEEVRDDITECNSLIDTAHHC